MKFCLAPALALAFALPLAAPAAAQPQGLKLWRLDCGAIDIDNLAAFSDTGLYSGEKRSFVASCYLIQNGNSYLLWDTGLDGALAGKPKDKEGSFLKEKVTAQMARIGIRPESVNFVGISHYHYDHTGQVQDFTGSTLLIGKGDWEIVKVWAPAKARFAPWLSGASKVEQVEGDRDVFGDGKVIMLDLPGHTEGHHGLLVKLASGPVLLTGDQYHFTEQVKNRGVPTFNVNRADTLASMDRFDRLAQNLKAKVIIQHEANDVAKLPAFPNAAE
jgi:glyoxylase-like metal-dependent hydrolase (beta-lactamase superfamily II)